MKIRYVMPIRQFYHNYLEIKLTTTTNVNMPRYNVHDTWESSRYSSRAFWAFYSRLIGPINWADQSETSPDSTVLNYLKDGTSGVNLPSKVESSDQTSAEYLEFIRVTREHQAERQRLKALELKNNPDLELEEYYRDVSQVNTLVEDNLVETPSYDNSPQLRLNEDEEQLIELYGNRDNYDRIQSMEMYIDEHFNQKYVELKPQFWPVIPLNPKPYLNPYK